MISRLLKKEKLKKSNDSTEKTITSFMRVWGYIILIGAYLITIFADLIFRSINEEYALREITITNVILGQIIFLLASLILLAVGHITYVKFKEIQSDLTEKYKLTEANMYKLRIFKRKKENTKSFRERLLGKEILIPVLIISVGIMVVYLIIHLNNLPAYFPKIPISYIAETLFLLAYIPSIFIAIMFTRLFYLIAIFYPNLRKNVETESLNLHPLHRDPTGGFGKSQNLLIFATFAVALVSFILIFFNVIIYLALKLIFMEEPSTPGEFLIVSLILSLIPIAFFIFVLVRPMWIIRSMVGNYKKQKINSILSEKSTYIEKIFPDKKKIIKEETIKALDSYDYYIDYYKSLSPWPRFFKTMSLIFTTISAVISFVISIPGVSDWIKSLIFTT